MTTQVERDVEEADIEWEEKVEELPRMMARKAMPMPEPPVGDTRYAFPTISAKVSDCAQYLAQCQAKVEEYDRDVTRATRNLAEATKKFAQARKVAEAWTKQMQDRLDEYS